MIYKVEIFEDSSKIEVQAETCDCIIHFHAAQGTENPERGGDIDYKNFFNVSLNERQAREMIKALKLGIKDLKKIIKNKK